VRQVCGSLAAAIQHAAALRSGSSCAHRSIVLLAPSALHSPQDLLVHHHSSPQLKPEHQCQPNLTSTVLIAVTRQTKRFQ
jgi:hypothetical protein